MAPVLSEVGPLFVLDGEADGEVAGGGVALGAVLPEEGEEGCVELGAGELGAGELGSGVLGVSETPGVCGRVEVGCGWVVVVCAKETSGRARVAARAR